MMEFILTESEFNEDNTAWNGNRFLMGNGYFGIRGTLEEYTKKQMCAVNMAECTGQEPEPTPHCPDLPGALPFSSESTD